MDFGWSGKSQIVTALHNNNSRNTGKFLFRRLTYSCKFIIQAIVIQELLMHHNNYWYIEYATSELNIQLEKKEDQSAIVETKKLSDIHSTFCLLYLSISLFSNYIRNRYFSTTTGKLCTRNIFNQTDCTKWLSIGLLTWRFSCSVSELLFSQSRGLSSSGRQYLLFPSLKTSSHWQSED